MTVLQKQYLLAFLGYYLGARIDGQWGSKSREATRKFQNDYGLEPDGTFGGKTEEMIRNVIGNGIQRKAQADDWWEEIRWFTPEEFHCKCAGRYCDGCPARMQREAVVVADRARDHFGRPGHIVSGLRCRAHNGDCGGVANSQHMYGEAVDLRIEGIAAGELLSYLQRQPEVRYAYSINRTNVHFDIPKGAR